MIEEKNLNSFLTVGYFMNYNKTKGAVPLLSDHRSKYEKMSLDDLIQYGSDLLLKVLEKHFTPGKKHLIPLSGGEDSRAILAGLLKFTDSSNIDTLTYGVPGSLDFDIGLRIAKEAKVSNLAINLNDVVYSQDMLIDAAKRFDFQTYLFFHPDYRVIEEKFGDHDYWGGFMGGEGAGSHFPFWQETNAGIEEAKKDFIKRNVFVNSLASKPVETIFDLVEIVEKPVANLTISEKINFYNRQTKFIAARLPAGFNHITPYASEEWLSFICSVPREYRVKRLLYEKILLKTFPEFFSLPTKNHNGLSLNPSMFDRFSNKVNTAILKRTGGGDKLKIRNRNYYNFNKRLRRDKKFQEVVINNLSDLRQRDIVPWVDIENILKMHMNESKNSGPELQVLASLELIIKAKEKK